MSELSRRTTGLRHAAPSTLLNSGGDRAGRGRWRVLLSPALHEVTQNVSG